MSTVNQIYNIVNSIAKATLGESAGYTDDNHTPFANYVSIGDTVLSSDENRDKFTKGLVDRIAKTVISVRRYDAQTGGLAKEPYEYGCIIQKIYVDLPDARINNSWEIGEDAYKAEFAPVIKPTVKQKLFEKITTWEVAVTIPDHMLKTAFTNPEKMATLIDAIFTVMDNKMGLALENNANLTRASFIARKAQTASTHGYINLLKEYNTLTNAGLTVASCMRNIEFLTWASMTIDLYRKRMEKMSKLFNDEGYVRHTDSEHLVLNVLQEFASATDCYLRSNVYHNNLVGLPNYKPVLYWMAGGSSYDFEHTSGVHLFMDDENKVKADANGVIAVMYDIDAMGITMDKLRSSSERNSHDEYTNYYNKAEIGYFNDMSENGIVFYISES